MALRSKAAYSERKGSKSTFILTLNRPGYLPIQGKENRLFHSPIASVIGTGGLNFLIAYALMILCHSLFEVVVRKFSPVLSNEIPMRKHSMTLESSQAVRQQNRNPPPGHNAERYAQVAGGATGAGTGLSGRWRAAVRLPPERMCRRPYPLQRRYSRRRPSRTYS